MSYPDIQVVIMDYKHIPPITREWLRQFDHVGYASEICDGGCGSQDFIVIKRNLVAQWFLERTDREYLVMIDEDVRPDIDTYLMLDNKADICSAHFFGKPGWLAHNHPGQVSMAACKISRSVFEKTDRPWFKILYNDYHTEVVKCECDWFASQVRLAGFYPVKAGRVVHAVTVLAVPPDDDKRTFKFLFPDKHRRRLLERTKKETPPTPEGEGGE